MKIYIPMAMVAFRAIIAPFTILIAYFAPQYKHWIAILAIIAIISDIFDGILARKWGVATAKLRLYDCWADLFFWLCACYCIWLCFPELVLNYQYWIIPLFILEPIPDLIYWFRFRKTGCSHAYSSKSFGVALVVMFCSLFLAEIAGIPFLIAIALGLISQTDRILIALLLPARICDIPSFYHAYLLKKGKTFKKNPLFHS